MKYSLLFIVILLLVSGFLGCSGVVKMGEGESWRNSRTKEWTDADGRQHTETTVTYIYEEQEKINGPEDKSRQLLVVLYYVDEYSAIVKLAADSNALTLQSL